MFAPSATASGFKFTITKFQSAPAIAGGRCRGRSPLTNPSTGFNPRPPLLAGDARVGLVVKLGAGDVSIRARHCWRAMPRESNLLEHGLIVSIRARHCWRAMRTCDGPVGSVRSLFQSAPAIAGGDAGFDLDDRDVVRVSIRARHCWRRCPRVLGAWHVHGGFNPRPPLLAAMPSAIP